MKKLFLVIIGLLLMVTQADTATYIDGVEQGASSFSVTDITGQTDDTTPATTATAVLAQGGSLIESTLGQIATAIGIPATGTANSFLGYNGAGAFGAYTRISSDDSAAQFFNASDPTKLVGIDASGMTAGKTFWFKPVFTDNMTATFTFSGTTGVTFPTSGTLSTAGSSETLTNKTYDVDGTGNVLKSWNYLVLTHPHLCAAGAPMQTTSTSNTYGQCNFGNATDKATNYAEYYLVVPPDIDTSVDLTTTFKIKLGGADTGDHQYEISFDSVANSAAYAGSLGDAVSLDFTADASGADGDVETAGETTLTGWRSAMTAGQLFVIRVARDGDDGTNDTSTVDSYSGPLIIKYKSTQ